MVVWPGLNSLFGNLPCHDEWSKADEWSNTAQTDSYLRVLLRAKEEGFALWSYKLWMM